MPRKPGSVDDKLIPILAAGTSFTEAGRQVGIGRKSVYLKMQQVEFRNRVIEFRSQMLQEGAGKLAAGFGESIDHLKHLMKKAKSEQTQMMAARAIGDLVLRVRDLEIERQVETMKAEFRAELDQIKGVMNSN